MGDLRSMMSKIDNVQEWDQEQKRPPTDDELMLKLIQSVIKLNLLVPCSIDESIANVVNQVESNLKALGVRPRDMQITSLPFSVHKNDVNESLYESDYLGVAVEKAVHNAYIENTRPGMPDNLAMKQVNQYIHHAVDTIPRNKK